MELNIWLLEGGRHGLMGVQRVRSRNMIKDAHN
jgi:hypothetical protein